MNDEAAFLKAIRKQPDDRTARLVFADWLQDRDDPRAAWVRDDDVWAWMKPDAKDPTDKLIAAIEKRYRHRLAYQALGKLGPTAVPAVLAALRAGSREHSLLGYALNRIGPTAEPVLPLLLDAAGEAHPHVRAGALQCLMPLAPTCPPAADAVVAATADADPDIRAAALQTIAATADDERVREKWRAVVPRLYEVAHDPPNAADRFAAVQMLVRLKAADESLIPLLVPLLSIEEHRSCATTGLGALGAPAVAAVLDAAEGLSGTAVRYALWAIAGTGAAAEPVLRAALADPRPMCRRLAALALARLRAAPEAVPEVVAALRADDYWERAEALDAVSRLGPLAAPALPALLALAERGTDVSQQLSMLGPALEPAVPTLLDYVEMRPDGDQLFWMLCVRGHGPAAVVAKLARPDAPGGQRSLYLKYGELEDVANDLWNAYHLSDQRETMCAVARAARQREPAEAVRAVQRLAAGGARATRIVAVFALQHVATPDAVAGLLAALKDKDRFVRACAVRALARVGKGVEGVLDALRAATADRSKEVRDAATKALAEG